jgi:hypothetical protein
LLVIFLFRVHPISYCISPLETSNLYLETSCDEDVIDVDKITDFLLVEILYDRANLRHNVELGREADCLSIFAEVLFERNFFLILEKYP